MKYECTAKCPELDKDNIPHCVEYIRNEEQLFNLLNKECPCGNDPKWIRRDMK